MKATITVPGHKPIVVHGFRYAREMGRLVFTLPDPERPFIQKALIVYEVPGLMVEVEEIIQQQPQPAAYPQMDFVVTGNHAAPEPEKRQFRSRVVPGQMPASEALDEAGNPVILPAAFGLAVG